MSNKGKITKEQLIEIVEAGFPEHIWNRIKTQPMDMLRVGEVYYFFNTDIPYEGLIPKHREISVIYDKEKKYVQFNAKYKEFNQYAAIKKMEELRLIGVADISEFCQPVDTKKATIKALEKLLEHIKTETEFEDYSFEMRLNHCRDYRSDDVVNVREFAVIRNEYINDQDINHL